MKITLLHISFILLFSININAQTNLVPNYSFEQYDTCPDGAAYLTPYCDDWFAPCALMIPEPPSPFSVNGRGSSDYFNVCSNHFHSRIPNNSIGFQYPQNGDAYAGFFFFANRATIANAKEYIEVELLESLINGEEYCLEFYYSVARYEAPFKYEIFEIGALLTDTLQIRETRPNSLLPANIIALPQVKQSLPIIKDTVNWIKVSGSFIANGDEKWLTIGNFQNTDTISALNVYVYTYIDNVKLYECNTDTNILIVVDSMLIPNVFTPNDDGYNDVFKFKFQEQWEFEPQIFNRWGHLIFDNSNSENWDGYIDGEKATPGVYYYVIKAVAIKTGKVVVYRGVVTVLY